MGFEAYWGLPETVIFCKNCCYSNQRPNSAHEFLHKSGGKKTSILFGNDDICDACKFNDLKVKIDWSERERQLTDLLDQHRKSDGSYDCIVPGSGGKDSVYAAHVLKYKYGMNPLTVTWPPFSYTKYGYANFKNWIDVGGLDNMSYNPNGRVLDLLTKLSVENLFHPFQTFILGQKLVAPKFAAKFDIPLVFYGEHEAEYGNPIVETENSLQSDSFHTIENYDDISIAGLSIQELKEDYGVNLADLAPYLPLPASEYRKKEIAVHYLGYYLKWQPQASYYYAVEHGGFEARPFRTEGTFSKYSGIDDKIDDLNYYTYFIKFGIGRCTEDVSQEIRNGHIKRDEGCALVDRYDGEFPETYFIEMMRKLNIDPDYFRYELTDKFRSPHLWAKDNGEWKLRHNVNSTGFNDK